MYTGYSNKYWHGPQKVQTASGSKNVQAFPLRCTCLPGTHTARIAVFGQVRANLQQHTLEALAAQTQMGRQAEELRKTSKVSIVQGCSSHGVRVD
jgi:hypothetical protein